MTEAERLKAIVAGLPVGPELKLLLLYGSRARRDDRAGSDWDLGHIAEPGFDPDDLLALLVEALGTDRIDLVDLERASGLLRYRAAADAQVVYAVDDQVFPRFWMAAVSFWCDMEPVLGPAYRDVLDRLD